MGGLRRVPVPRTSLNDIEYCRRCAQGLRDLAAQMSSDVAREQLFRMAEEYDRLACLDGQHGKSGRPGS